MGRAYRNVGWVTVAALLMAGCSGEASIETSGEPPIDGGSPFVDAGASDAALSTTPTWPAGTHAILQALGPTSLRFSWPSAIDDGGIVAYAVSENGHELARVNGSSLTYDLANLTAGTQKRLSVVAYDGDGNASSSLDASATVHEPTPSEVALTPAGLAPSFAARTSFLWTGSDPLQRAVDAAAISAKRVVVLRGRVTGSSGTALEGVRVRVLDHSEFGYAVTREDGAYDFATNGGGPISVVFEKSDHLPGQRAIPSPWNDFVAVDDVVLLARAAAQVPAVTAASLQSTAIVPGPATTDARGTRTPDVTIEPGTTITGVKPDGSTVSLPSATVRLTEYTTGDRGLQQMPGTLPATTAFTYAIELSVDEADAIGATTVRFSKPVAFHVDNFLNFVSGAPIPVGTFDAATNRWVGMDAARVVKVVSVTGGLADLDLNGDGAADNAAALSVDGYTDGERQQIASRFSVGKTLWRARTDHFTPMDCNMGWTLPSDATRPNGRVSGKGSDSTDDCDAKGSRIGCLSQSLRQRVPIEGTGMALTYASERVPGRLDPRTITVTDGTAPPASATAVELDISVAGRSYRRSYTPAANLSYDLLWDGLDAYGRRATGDTRAEVRIGFSYPAAYTPGTVWGGIGVFDVNGATSSSPIGTVWQTQVATLRSDDARRESLGGWLLSGHHSLDPASLTMYLGSGDTLHPKAAERIVTGGPNTVLLHLGGGTDATRASGTASNYLAFTRGFAYDAEGTLWDSQNGRLTRVTSDGAWATVLKTTDVGAYAFHEMAVVPDGGVVLSDYTNSAIYRYDVRTGRGTRLTRLITGAPQVCPVENALLSTTSIPNPGSLVAAPDGTLFVWSSMCKRIYRVGTDGRVSTYAGKDRMSYSCANYTGTSAVGSLSRDLPPLHSLAMDRDGSLYASSSTCNVVFKLSPDGTIVRFAGTAAGGYSGDGLATSVKIFSPSSLVVDDDQGLIFVDGNNKRIRRVSPSGMLTTIVGNGQNIAATLSGRSAATAPIGVPGAIAKSPDGRLLFVSSTTRGSTGYFRVELAPLVPSTLANVAYTFLSPNGAELYDFDDHGRHLTTRHAASFQTKATFAYDSSDRLTLVTSGAGATLRINRDSSGNPTSIVGPGGQSTALALDANGWLSSIVAPSGARTTLVTNASGLLTAFTSPKGLAKSYGYEADGRLASAAGAATGNASFTRVNTSTGHVVTETRGSLASTTEVGVLTDGSRVVRKSSPSGAIDTMTVSADGLTTTTNRSDGATITNTRQDDPVLGAGHLINATFTVRTPAGLTRTVTTGRTAVFSEPGDPASLTSRVDTTQVGSSTFTRTYEASTRTLTTRSAAGVTSTTTFDTQGRAVSFAPDTSSSLTPVTIAYGANGRTSEMSQGSRKWKLSYGAAGELTAIEDGLARSVQIARDSAGRLRRSTSPLGRVVERAYDADGNLAQIALPSTTVHTLARDTHGRLTGWTPPVGTGLTRTFDAAGRLTQTALAGGRTQSWTYDASGRSTGLQTPEGTTSFAFNDATNRMSSSMWSPTVGAAITEAFGWDGPLATGIVYGGGVTTRFGFAYDAAFNVAAVTRNGSPLFTFTRNADGAVTADGLVAFTRTGPRGTVSKATVGTSELATTYDAYGAVAGRTLSQGGRSVFELALTHDAAGRVTGRRVTIDGSTDDDTLAYDLDNELTSVTRASTAIESFAYDVDGNRTSATRNATARASTFDGNGRLTALNGTAYAFTNDGFLSERGTERFSYGSRGELLSFTGAAGPVSYGYDARGRRISRTDAAGTTVVEYARPDAFHLITGIADNAGTWVFHHDDGGWLIAAERGADRYLLGTDQVGSVRAVFSSTGVLLKRIDYDAFGAVVADSAPAFAFPLGFAGGLTDAATGLVHFGARDYEPASGRWTTPDPFLFDGRQSNLYAYVNNSPTLRRDPSGLLSISISGYAGIGLSIDLAVTSEGFSSCIGAGVGLGVVADLDVLGDLASDSSGTDLFSKVGAEAGIEGLISGEFELKATRSFTSPCSKVSAEFGVNGPVGIPLYSNESGIDQAGNWENESTSVLDHHSFNDVDPSDYSTIEGVGEGEAEGSEIKTQSKEGSAVGASASVSASTGICSTYKW